MGAASRVKQAKAIVASTLDGDGYGDVERLLIMGAIVEREGDHFRLVEDPDAKAELDALSCRSQGLCDCGSTLSRRQERACCRTCGREYRSG